MCQLFDLKKTAKTTSSGSTSTVQSCAAICSAGTVSYSGSSLTISCCTTNNCNSLSSSSSSSPSVLKSSGIKKIFVWILLVGVYLCKFVWKIKKEE